MKASDMRKERQNSQIKTSLLQGKDFALPVLLNTAANNLKRFTATRQYRSTLKETIIKKIIGITHKYIYISHMPCDKNKWAL